MEAPDKPVRMPSCPGCPLDFDRYLLYNVVKLTGTCYRGKERRELTEQNRQEALLFEFDRVMRLLRRRPAGMPNYGRGTYRLLDRIQGNSGLSTRALAELMDVRPSSLNEALAGLEREGLLLRRRNPEDQRVFIVRLLPKGEEQLEKMRAAKGLVGAEIGKLLTEDEALALTRLAGKLADGLEALTPSSEQDTPRRHPGRAGGWR